MNSNKLLCSKKQFTEYSLTSIPLLVCLITLALQEVTIRRGCYYRTTYFSVQLAAYVF